MDLQLFTTGITLLRNALGLAKEANELGADSQKRRAAEVALEQAEQQLRLAETRAAAELGYHLCQCTFPPQIALLQRDHSRKCPACGRDTNEDYRSRGGGSY